MSTLIAYLQLCRIPAVFTALADILLGFLLARSDLRPVPTLTLLLLSSAGLYLAGMVLNDLFDRDVDARERPRRPLPSGRVSLSGARLFAAALLILGLTAASLAGTTSLFIAAILTAAIFAYDGLIKNTPVAPLFMGSCRFLNVLLGASASAATLSDVFRQPNLWIAAGLGTYIVGVTTFSRGEASVSRKSLLTLGASIVNGGLAALAAWIYFSSHPVKPRFALAVIAVTIFTLNRRMLAAIISPQPALVQATVKTMLLSLIILDATLAYNWVGNSLAHFPLAIALLIIPDLLSSRIMSIT